MTTNVSNPVAQLLNTGNLVVRDADADDGISTYAWQGFDYPTDTMLAGMKVGVDFVKRLNRTLTAWTSDSDPSPSTYNSMMEVHGDPELVLYAGSKKVWRTGPWNGLRFSGIPGTLTYTGFNFSFINNEQEITYSFNTSSSILSKMTLNHSGEIQRSFWVEDSGTWNVMWYAPIDQCDTIRLCGPFASCNPNNSPVCDCIQGFTPKSPVKWLYGRDATDGCVRKTKLDCKNGTEGFHVISNTKLADTLNASVDKNLSLADCRTKCMDTCSCTAYAPADVRNGGSGCIIWTSELTDLRVFTNVAYGQDLYVRLAAIDLDQSSTASGKSSKWVIPLVIILVSMLLIFAYIGYLIWKRRKRRQSRGMQVSNNSSHDLKNHGNDLELPLLDFGTIVSATENFSADNKLGEGGFGPVYKGAASKERKDSWFMSKPKEEGLDWQTRFKIIMGIARGLLYLHQDSRLRVIHRDLKTSNILLDKDMNPKISDFGTARIFGGDEVEGNTKKVVGTYGYMSPEYAMDGIFSQKSDVFSFGVLMLEIITGKKNRGVYFASAHTNLLDHASMEFMEGGEQLANG
ncbi:hypothetical protein J5N97_028015 [Dioscorea zingiberensis]|uniref:non-specific serine/threonine protein kinase n=1 Tax=Dioscorea zingiberensis TaxID=325984 RepID=A0A9D5BY65_9LILI|nr:hypothetical protein J5N97_028015 [Dioscorea zingiberensis]